MPGAPARPHHVVPEDALFPRSNARDRRALAFVQRIRLWLHAHAAQRFESMLQQQVLRLRIHGRALPVARYPRPSDLHAMVRAVNVAIARAPETLGCMRVEQK